MKRRRIISRVFVWLVLTVLYLPILLITIFSFSNTRTISLRNFKFGFDLYINLFKSETIMAAVGNTLFIAVLSSLIATLIGTIACVGILSMPRRRKNAIMLMNQLPMINADIVTAFGFVLFFALIGAFNMGYFKLILAHTMICLPFVVITVLPRLRQLDTNLFEAGQDLGATPMQSLFKVVIPQLIPAMLSAFLLGFTLSLDDFIITQFNNDGISTISTIVYSQTKRSVDPAFRALSAIIFMAVIAVLLIINFKSKKKPKNSSEAGT